MFGRAIATQTKCNDYRKIKKQGAELKENKATFECIESVLKVFNQSYIAYNENKVGKIYNNTQSIIQEYTEIN